MNNQLVKVSAFLKYFFLESYVAACWFFCGIAFFKDEYDIAFAAGLAALIRYIIEE